MRPQGTVQYDNSDRIVVVTGGSSGIGEAICREFARSGAVVFSADITESDNPVEGVTHLPCNTKLDYDCGRVIQKVIAEHGALDILVNNAAIQPPESYVPLHELPAQVWNRIVDINLTGYTWMAMHALRQMQQQKSLNLMIWYLCSSAQFLRLEVQQRSWPCVSWTVGGHCDLLWCDL